MSDRELLPADQQLQIGDIAIVVDPLSAHHGMEALILSGPVHGEYIVRDSDRIAIGTFHYVEINGSRLTERGNDLVKLVRNLRKKRPPAELSSWSDVQKACGWKPRSVEADSTFKEWKECNRV